MFKNKLQTMKIIKLIKADSIQFVLMMGILLAASSCSENQNSNTVSDNDSSGTSGNTTSVDSAMNSMSNNTEQNNMMTDTSNINRLNAGDNSNADAAFMMKAAEINMEEIKLGNLAKQKGTMAHVKELGSMLVTEHTKAMTALNAAAKSKMTTLPTTETEKITDAYNILNAKSGKDFDKAYSDMMVNGHKEAIALFEKTNRDTKDADIKSFTSAMIPKLKTHLEHAEKCKRECEKM